MNEPAANTSPDALFLLGTHCPHCPGMLQGLANLVKAGILGTLKVVNIEQRIDIARELGVRSVPWVRIGSFELEGLHSEQELREWALKAGTDSGMTDWLNDLLSSGNISKPLERVRSDPETMDALLELFTDPDTQLNTRIGISAIMEDLEGTDTLQRGCRSSRQIDTSRGCTYPWRRLPLPGAGRHAEGQRLHQASAG